MLALDMMEIKFAAFFLALFRVGGFCLSAPMFNGKLLPSFVKIAFSAALALLLIPVVKVPETAYSSWGYLLLITGMELLIGLALGFLVQLLFMATLLVGHILDLQVGIMVGSIFNPELELQEPLMGRLHHLLALLLFLALNAHLWLINGLANTYKILPPMGAHITGNFIRSLSHMTSDIFLVALKIGAPIILVLFLADLGLAILSRAIPQMNAFFVAFPLKLILGFFVTALAMPYIVGLLSGEMRTWITNAIVSISHLR